ncbi:hypothetical protein MPER_07170, partial [Moniliophthora perniciosa FA553]
MIRSGELMKYPLAIVNALIDNYGPKLGIGYDIMCAFYKTLCRSPKLRQKVIKSGLVGIVPAFHGHAHNRKCQLSWHPQYVDGVGIEDFEECERTFSLSNQLASTTRLTNRFHRRQSMLEFFQFHDEDKFTASAKFIYQNYRQSLDRIAKNGPVFDSACAELRLTPERCEELYRMEVEYFSQPLEPPENESRDQQYVELLNKLWAAEKESNDAHKEWRKLGTSGTRSMTDKQIQSIKSRNSSTFRRLSTIQEEIACFEDDNGIYPRWKVSDAQYLDAQKSVLEGQYRRAVEELERLVVSRLFEMSS